VNVAVLSLGAAFFTEKKDNQQCPIKNVMPWGMSGHPVSVLVDIATRSRRTQTLCHITMSTRGGGCGSPQGTVAYYIQEQFTRRDVCLISWRTGSVSDSSPEGCEFNSHRGHSHALNAPPFLDIDCCAIEWLMLLVM
jgi:hypothetical protein